MEKTPLLEDIERYRRLLIFGPNDARVYTTLCELLAEAEAAVAALGNAEPEVA